MPLTFFTGSLVIEDLFSMFLKCFSVPLMESLPLQNGTQMAYGQWHKHHDSCTILKQCMNAAVYWACTYCMHASVCVLGVLFDMCIAL